MEEVNFDDIQTFISEITIASEKWTSPQKSSYFHNYLWAHINYSLLINKNLSFS